MSRFEELMATTPPATLGIIALNVFLYVMQVALDLDLSLFTLCLRLVVYKFQLYRIQRKVLTNNLQPWISF